MLPIPVHRHRHRHRGGKGAPLPATRFCTELGGGENRTQREDDVSSSFVCKWVSRTGTEMPYKKPKELTEWPGLSPFHSSHWVKREHGTQNSETAKDSLLSKLRH